MKIPDAKIELEKIMQQKTVSITRLERVLAVLDYESLEKRYIQQGKINKRQKGIIQAHEERIKNQRREIAELRRVLRRERNEWRRFRKNNHNRLS